MVEAIDEKDPEHLKEELGDVLLQVVFHAQMAREEGLFTFDDVVDGVAQKMVFRHPHVFGQARADDCAQALDTWDAQKREEKDQRTASDTLKGVARSLPALIRAEKIQSKAAKAGFDWPDPAPALDKLAEEADELRRAAQGDGDPEEELGDLLFAAVKAGRFLGLDSEQALTRACDKFIRRFQTVEERAGGRPLGELPLEELEALWAQAKAEERRAMAVAKEQEMRAYVVEAEAEVPKALAYALREGKMGVMDYYELQNLKADTDMRSSISGAGSIDVDLTGDGRND